MLSAGRRACHRVCWGGAGECSYGAPAAARHLPARVWCADARRLIRRCPHCKKASAGSTRPTQSSSQTPQGGNTTGGKQHRGETAHGETHPPTRDVRAPWGCRAYFCVFFGLHLRLCARLCVSFVAVKGLYKLLRPQWLPTARWELLAPTRYRKND